ncbi:MAG TPA: DUF6282 family protein [Chloroflexota bacterium]|jgi:hypothetical protein
MAIDTATQAAATEAVRYSAEAGAPRYLTSYIARRAYKDEVQHPPVVNGVRGVIDVHCHAHDGQQDALDLAKYASVNGMRGLLYKSIVGRARPAESVRKLLDALHRWAEEAKVEPIQAWAGYNIGSGDELASPATVREQIEDGVTAIWMPTARSARTLHKIGGPPIWWDKTANPRSHTGPLPWEEAKRNGHFLLEDSFELKASVREIFHVVADTGVTVSFAHATHPELFAMAEETKRLGIKRALVDHPFSPFVDLNLEQMRQLTSEGIYLNFTFDELSPLLGVDPAVMCDTIRSLGVDCVTLSSDCGEPLFPNSVEAMRQIRGYMRAFGLSAEEVDVATIRNPEKLVGLQ